MKKTHRHAVCGAFDRTGGVCAGRGSCRACTDGYGSVLHHRCDTGLVLAQQNMNEELHPASITKVMTLGLACEKAQGKWDNVKLTVSHEDVYSLAGTDSSHIALQEGEEVPLTDALYATMMPAPTMGQPAGRILRRRLH